MGHGTLPAGSGIALPVLLPVSEKTGMSVSSNRAAVRPGIATATWARVFCILALASAFPSWTVLPLQAQVTSHLRVSVRESGSERPLGAIEVEVVGGGVAPVRTGPDGRVLVRGVSPGRHTVRAHGAGFLVGEQVVDAENGATVDVVFRLQPTPVRLEGLDVEVEALPQGARTLGAENFGAEARTLDDVVEALPGVQVVRRGGPGTPAVPRIRGSSGDQVLVLVDGVALNSPLTGEADLAVVDLANVARVTVVPGASAARYGAGALAGAILIETFRHGASAVRARLETGSLDTWAVGGSADLATPGSAWRWALGGEWNRSAGDFEYPIPDVRGGGVGTRENAQAEWVSGYLETAWNPTDGPRIRLRLHARDAERGSPGTVVQPSTTGRNEETRLGAVLQGEGGSAGRGWRASFGVDRTESLIHDPTPPFGEAYRADSRVGRLEGRGETRLRAAGIDWRAGVDGRGWDIESSTLSPGSPDRVLGGGGWLHGVWRATGTRGSVEVGAGLRGDLHDFLDGLVMSPSASVLLSRRGTSLEAMVGGAVSPPDVSDLFFQEGVLAEPNPELAPERVRGEVGLELRQTFQGGGWTGTVGASAYRADVDGMILWFPDFRFVWSPRNVDVERQGLEFGTELQAGALTFLRGDVGWTRVRYANSILEGQVVYRPEFTADVSASLDLVGLDWSARWRWIGERRTSPGTELNTLPGYGRLDAAVRWPFRLDAMGGAVELAVQNVLDEPAALLVDYPLPGRMLSLRVRAGPAGG